MKCIKNLVRSCEFDTIVYLFRVYRNLSRDDTPMVRCSAASNLGEFAAEVEMKYLRSDLLPLFTALAGDEQVGTSHVSSSTKVILGSHKL